jgi:hypothetical protein
MLTRIDRLQLAVPDREAAASGWVALLGAEKHDEDRVAGLAAHRSRYRLGRGWIELLEPDGAGPLGAALAARGGGHLFAAGASTVDLEALVKRLRERGVDPLLEGGQAHLDPASTGGHGLRLVLSPDESLGPVGHVDFLYEVTNLVADAPAAVAGCAELFGLDPTVFVPIESAHYGYDGTLSLFDPDRLDRFELITPRVAANTMGRFFDRLGECLYMAFGESGQLEKIEERARERGAGFTAEPAPDRRDNRGAHTLFLHPPALGGAMLGLSRPGWAWMWSGRPDRAEAGS